MKTSYSRLQLTYYVFQIVKLGLLFAFSVVSVGASVGRWRFTFRALRCLVAKPATEITFATKSCSGAKLHWCIIIRLVGYINKNGYKAFTITLFVNDVSLCKHRTDLLSYLHSCLQIDGSLRINPALYISL